MLSKLRCLGQESRSNTLYFSAVSLTIRLSNNFLDFSVRFGTILQEHNPNMEYEQRCGRLFFHGNYEGNGRGYL